MKKSVIVIAAIATVSVVAAAICRRNNSAANAILRANVEALADKDVYPLCGWDPSLECVYDFGNGDIETWEGVKIRE